MSAHDAAPHVPIAAGEEAGGSGLSEAGAHTLLAADIMSLILRHHAIATHGYSREFVTAAEVNSVWREAVCITHGWIEAWHEYSFSVSGISQLLKSCPDDEGIIVAPSQGLSPRVVPYTWSLWFFPKTWRLARGGDDDGDDDPDGKSVQVVGVYLKAPEQLDAVDADWARRTECELTLHHPTDPARSRRKYFRHHFTAQDSDWGFPDGSACSSFGTTRELLGRRSAVASAGFVANDTLMLSARICVRSGRLQCTKEAKGCSAHALQLDDGLAYHVRRVDAPLLFHCDLCGVTLPTHELHRCSRGCNFDVCKACVDPTVHVFV